MRIIQKLSQLSKIFLLLSLAVTSNSHAQSLDILEIFDAIPAHTCADLFEKRYTIPPSQIATIKAYRKLRQTGRTQDAVALIMSEFFNKYTSLASSATTDVLEAIGDRVDSLRSKEEAQKLFLKLEAIAPRAIEKKLLLSPDYLLKISTAVRRFQVPVPNFIELMNQTVFFHAVTLSITEPRLAKRSVKSLLKLSESPWTQIPALRALAETKRWILPADFSSAMHTEITDAHITADIVDVAFSTWQIEKLRRLENNPHLRNTTHYPITQAEDDANSLLFANEFFYDTILGSFARGKSRHVSLKAPSWDYSTYVLSALRMVEKSIYVNAINRLNERIFRYSKIPNLNPKHKEKFDNLIDIFTLIPKNPSGPPDPNAFASILKYIEYVQANSSHQLHKVLWDRAALATQGYEHPYTAYDLAIERIKSGVGDETLYWAGLLLQIPYWIDDLCKESNFLINDWTTDPLELENRLKQMRK